LRTKKYRRTIPGLISGIYTSQKTHSKLRGHNPPSYTKEELFSWIMSQKNFLRMMKDWETSNYSKDFTPSIDRLDDYKAYSLDNIQLISWEDHYRKTYLDRVLGNNKKTTKAVVRIDKEGCREEFFSMSEAGRRSGVGNSKISLVCSGKRKTAGGFKWEYKNKTK